MNFTDWKQTAIGRFINTDGWYGSQCVDVLMDYAKSLFPGHDWPELLGYGNAKDLFDTANPAFFDKIPNDRNDPNQLPQPGDIMIYGATQWNEFGHCGICDGADSGGVNLIQQDGTYDPNGDGNADGTCFEKYRPWGTSVCIGWLRPRPQTAAPQPQQLLGYQRVVGTEGVNYRRESNTSAEVIQEFASGEVLDFKGFVRGENYGGNDIWFVGRYTGGYCWSGAFTDSGTHDLDDLTPAPQPVPQPETPTLPPAAPAPYSFEQDLPCVTEVIPAGNGSFERGNFPDKPEKVVIHDFGTLNVDTIGSTINWFKKENNISAHFVVSGKRIVQMVSLKDRAYHAGPNGNMYVGIETDPAQDAETIASVRALLKALNAYYGYTLTPLKHSSIMATDCGDDINLDTYQIDEATPVQPTPAPAKKATKTITRVGVFALISSLIEFYLSTLLQYIPDGSVTTSLTVILTWLDKYIHENPNIDWRGLLPF